MSTGRYHWSNIAPDAKFFMINATAAVPWLALILFPRMKVLIFAAVTTCFLLYVQSKKMSVSAFIKSKKTLFLGKSIRVERSLKD